MNYSMKRLGLVFIMVFLLGSIATAQRKTFAIEDVDSLMQTERKPILVLLSTNRCTYCHMQKKQLEKDKDFIEKADNFYYVIFDAAQESPVIFSKRLFRYKPNGTSSGIHELAVALNGSEKIAFPTWVILNSDYQVIFHHNGILPPKYLNEILNKDLIH